MRAEIKKESAGLFDYQERIEELKRRETSLDKLNKSINWEWFREGLEKQLKYSDGRTGGRPSYDVVLMLKIIVLQKYYSLSEEETEFQIMDRFSFQRFLGLDVADKVPDKNTIWVFKERLGVKGVKKLFKRFEQVLGEKGLLASKGKIVDASFVEVRRQRNSREDNGRIQSGQSPEGWDANPSKKRQKDVDARWSRQKGITHYGYKNHVKANRKTKLIETYEVSSASETDGSCIEALLDEHTDGVLYADKAYRSHEISELLRKKNIRNHIHDKGCRYMKLTEQQHQKNHKKSSIRCRVEHIFAFQKQNMKANWIRTIGLPRARQQIGLNNWIYNLFRFKQLGYAMT